MCMCREARLYVTGNGQGSPCLDLRRVPDTLADATVGTDLVIVEGMGRAIHTNYKCAPIAQIRKVAAGERCLVACICALLSRDQKLASIDCLLTETEEVHVVDQCLFAKSPVISY